jgi:hemoglobin-like flavoprotein
MKDIYDSVVASYHRCRQTGQFFDAFYKIFLHASPEIAALFAQTDIVRQKLMMKQSLLEMLSYYCGTDSARQDIERLGKLHQRFNLRPEHYALWLKSLCEAVAQHDPKFSEDLGEQWREAMQPGIELMHSLGPVTERLPNKPQGD